MDIVDIIVVIMRCTLSGHKLRWRLFKLSDVAFMDALLRLATQDHERFIRRSVGR